MATAKALPVQVALSEADYLVLLKHAPKGSRVLRCLTGVAEDDRPRRKGSYVFTCFLTDGLALRALALAHAPDAVAAIERALKRAREG
jgi:hypothetical protein